jgi:hypothetical protein
MHVTDMSQHLLMATNHAPPVNITGICIISKLYPEVGTEFKYDGYSKSNLQ